MATSTSETLAAPALQPWRGRLFLLAGVVLLGLSLRHAVTVVSPLLSTIQRDIGLDQVGATILGMLPTIAFGIAGFIAPTVIRAVGLRQAAVLAMGLGACQSQNLVEHRGRRCWSTGKTPRLQLVYAENTGVMRWRQGDGNGTSTSQNLNVAPGVNGER